MIDADDLAAFLSGISASYESQQDIQLMRFADYLGRAFSKVIASQFPWMKTLKESSVARMIDIPFSLIPEDVYKTSVEWLNQRSIESLSSFAMWLLDSILADFSLHQAVGKGSKKAVQQALSNSLVAIFVALSMVLRRKPDVLIRLLPTMKEGKSYQGQDKLPVIIWTITQATQGDLAAGLFMWMHLLVPLMNGKTGSNPLSRGLILQVVERIISSPKARTILVNCSVKKGERLVPPSALELLMRLTFSPSSARIKATERFEAVYPILRDVALSVSPGSKAMKQITQQIMPFAIKAAGEGVPELSREASSLVFWCLTQNPDCYKQWDDMYLENIESSAIVLSKFSNEWKVHSVENLITLKVTLSSFMKKNEKGLASGNYSAHQASLRDAQKHCKMLLRQLSGTYGCLKSVTVVALSLLVGAAFMSNGMESWELKQLLVDFNISRNNSQI